MINSSARKGEGGGGGLRTETGINETGKRKRLGRSAGHGSSTPQASGERSEAPPLMTGKFSLLCCCSVVQLDTAAAGTTAAAPRMASGERS